MVMKKLEYSPTSTQYQASPRLASERTIDSAPDEAMTFIKYTSVMDPNDPLLLLSCLRDGPGEVLCAVITRTPHGRSHCAANHIEYYSFLSTHALNILTTLFYRHVFPGPCE